MGLDFLYISSTIEFLMLFILVFVGKIGCKLSKSKNKKLLKWSFIFISLLGFYLSSIPRFVLTFYLFFVQDYTINFGGFNTIPQINIPLFVLMVITIITFLVSKFIWNKKTV
ncbi:hypothetical protein N9544_05450 [Flavobacteriales bacterium]|nr:hypothetical protein [Flavobacteriales bacterium]